MYDKDLNESELSAYLQIYFPIFHPQVMLSLCLHCKELYRTTQPIHAYKGYADKKECIVYSTKNRLCKKILFEKEPPYTLDPLLKCQFYMSELFWFGNNNQNRPELMYPHVLSLPFLWEPYTKGVKNLYST